jgi:hypothetical protein
VEEESHIRLRAAEGGGGENIQFCNLLNCKPFNFYSSYALNKVFREVMRSICHKFLHIIFLERNMPHGTIGSNQKKLKILHY